MSTDAYTRFASAAGPALRTLAAAVSIAARADRAVVRGLRRTLVPQSDATLEAELWFSAVVAHRSADAITLASEVLAPLRAELVASGQLAVARDVVRAVHRDAQPLVVLEEELIHLGVTGADPAAISDRLGEVLAAMRAQPERALDIAGWVLHALPRLPALCRATGAAWSLAFAAQARSGYAVTLGDTPPVDGVRLDPSVPVVPAQVALASGRLVLGGAARSGSVAITVSETTPRVVVIEQAGQRRAVAFAPEASTVVELGAGDLVVANLRGDRWQITSAVAPSRAGSERWHNGYAILVDGSDHPRAGELGRALAAGGFDLVTLDEVNPREVVELEFVKALDGVESYYYRWHHVVDRERAQRPYQAAVKGATVIAAEGESSPRAAIARVDALVTLNATTAPSELATVAAREAVPRLALGTLLPEVFIAQLRGVLNVPDPAFPFEVLELAEDVARVLNRADVADFHRTTYTIEGMVGGRDIVEAVCGSLITDDRAAYRCVGYVAARNPPCALLVTALQQEQTTLRRWQDPRSLDLSLLQLLRADAAAEPPVRRALAAACAVLLLELGAQDRLDTRRELTTTLSSQLARFDPETRTTALSAHAVHYERLRTEPAGEDRTSRMQAIVDEIAHRQVRPPVLPEATTWFMSGRDGPRMVGLALLEGVPEPDGFECVELAITGPRSPFEQYTALIVADRMLPGLEKLARQRLASALRRARTGPDATITNEDSSRWFLSAQLLTRLGEPGG